MTASTTRRLLPLLACMSLAGCSGGETGAARFLSIGTGGTGGVYYPLGGAIASRLSALDPDRQYTAEVTGGSVENVARIANGQIDLAFVLGVTAYEAYNGGEDYPTAITGLRVLAPMYPNLTHVLVGRSVQAASLADLRGMTVSVGSAGSGTEQVARQILGAVGLTYDDLDARYLSFGESASALADGAIDAAILSVGYPAAAVLEATTTGGARLLPIGPEEVRALQTRYPYYSSGTIPPGVYRGIEEPVPTAAMMNWVVALEGVDDGVVRNLLRIVTTDRDDLARAHEMAAQIDMASLADTPIPLHAVTAEWWAQRSAEPAEGAPDIDPGTSG